MRSPHAAILPGLAAAATEGVAAALCVGAITMQALLIAGGLHAVAVVLARVAAARRPGSRVCDLDLVTLIALAAPPLGAVIGWLMPPGPNGRGCDAHEAFEAGETGSTSPHIDWTARAAAAAAADDALPLSFDEILLHGSIEHRRNALRRLAALGEPRHLRLVRRALGHTDPELRLAAFAELDRVGRSYERMLERARENLRSAEREEDVPKIGAARARLAERHREFADSGLLDPAMAEYHRDRADRVDADADHDDSAALVARARAAIGRGAVDEALQTLSDDATDPRLAVARAEALWAARRFDELESLAERLVDRWPEAAPSWLRQFLVARTPEESEP